jgi:hypothetical protein
MIEGQFLVHVIPLLFKDRISLDEFQSNYFSRYCTQGLAGSPIKYLFSFEVLGVCSKTMSLVTGIIVYLEFSKTTCINKKEVLTFKGHGTNKHYYLSFFSRKDALNYVGKSFFLNRFQFNDIAYYSNLPLSDIISESDDFRFPFDRYL